MSIKVDSIHKNYGNQKVLQNVSFSASKGEIIGFLGPNGAGKSTLMKILTGFIKPDSGEVFVDDKYVLQNPLEAQKSTGYLPEQNPLYKEMFVREYLEFQASIYKVDRGKIEEIIENVGLKSEAHKKIHQLSKGYQQRVGLAAAIIHNPIVLILDEPTTGLDVNQLVEIRELIKKLGKEKTVLFSTHIMQEVEAVCDRVIVINKGEILLDKTLDELENLQQQIIEVTFNKVIEEEIFNQLENIKTINVMDDSTYQLIFNSSEDMRSKIFDLAQQNELKILELSSKRKNLETIFREITSN